MEFLIPNNPNTQLYEKISKSNFGRAFASLSNCLGIYVFNHVSGVVAKPFGIFSE
jgi:hypothetical protein